MSNIKDNIKPIVKLIERLYNPTKVEVKSYKSAGEREYVITFYFDTVSDEYITNRFHNQRKKHKEENLTRKIRTNIEDYLDIKTTGLQPRNKFYSPMERHNITIMVKSEK